MYFTKSNKSTEMPSIHVNGIEIDIVKNVKYLGIHLDQTLSFKNHMKRKRNLLKYNISSFRHIRKSLTIEASFMYFNAMIIPHFTYCLSCWSQANETTLIPLRSLYNQTLKILDRKPLRQHHCNIISKYKILSFDNLILYSNLRIVFKIVNNIAPPSLKNLLNSTLIKQSEHHAPPYIETVPHFTDLLLFQSQLSHTKPSRNGTTFH